VTDGLVFVRGVGYAANAFAEDLPGRHAVMRTNSLLAWRCKACHLVTFKYGRDNAKHLDRMAELDADAQAAEDGEGEASQDG